VSSTKSCPVVFETALGRMAIEASAMGVRRIWLAPPDDPTPSWSANHLGPLVAKLRAWARGESVSFDDVALDLDGTAFERAVWDETRRIPAGETRTYGQIARTLGKPGAARAVGAALGRNPVPVIVPCHRVVASDGSMCGFSAPGGIELKKRMLGLERAHGALAADPSRRRTST
jgi:methylated-DNA-[protein]-cysteine S-methyltransferase